MIETKVKRKTQTNTKEGLIKRIIEYECKNKVVINERTRMQVKYFDYMTRIEMLLDDQTLSKITFNSHVGSEIVNKRLKYTETRIVESDKINKQTIFIQKLEPVIENEFPVYTAKDVSFEIGFYEE